ncbi:MAG: RNA pyrophosphohydrolase [Rhodospirillales bacterium]|nr:RNA pyrophosphohydrolase [Rhodospirillales bacterium]MCB9995719.1 RNA pyrophosphohydrolase [Rhodospirillales bacterium]
MSKTDYSHLPYRACVGIALFNDDNNVFVGERLDNPGAWQLPQGGIDDGETVEQAFFREMQEEIGTDKAEIIKIHDEVMRYDLPPHLLGKLWSGKYCGQEQTWVAARFTGTDADINIYYDRFPEFKAWQWVGLNEILNLIVPFKRDTYRQVIEAFKDI